MQQTVGRTPGNGAGSAKRPTGAALSSLAVGLLAPAMLLLSGCASGDEMMSSVVLPATQSAEPPFGADGAAAAPPGDGGTQSGGLDVTPQQRAYLDALVAEGVHASSDLLALSIGAYVCQARAAGQADQAVWDFVVPLVRTDVTESHPAAAPVATGSQVDAVTANYIRIATERLC